MGYLAHIVLALVAQAVASGGFALEDPRPLAVLALALVPHTLGWSARALFVSGRFRAGEAVYRLLHWAPPLLYAAATCAFGWLRSVEQWTGHTVSLLAWPDWTVVALVVPFLVYEIAAIDARARATVAHGERARWRTFQVRLFL